VDPLSSLGDGTKESSDAVDDETPRGGMEMLVPITALLCMDC
jgi:hypothetical protein